MEEAQVRQAVQRARAAFRIWGRLEFAERREQLLRVRDLMLDRADEVVARVCDETGKTRFEAMFTELFVTADLMDFYARHGEKALRPQRVANGPLRLTKRSYKVYEPLGACSRPPTSNGPARGRCGEPAATRARRASPSSGPMSKPASTTRSSTMSWPRPAPSARAPRQATWV